jgi:RNA polymerase sigma factor (sigma-70 family)
MAMTLNTIETFANLIRKVRGGDSDAAAEIVRDYEPEIRREIRLRLRDPRLRRSFDSADVCQSVLASFFARAASGGYTIDRPEHLLGLLISMARNKLIRRVRRQRALRRDDRRMEPGGHRGLESVAGTDSPCRSVEDRDLIDEVRPLLSAEEWEMAELRSEGRAWSEIASELGGTPEGRRKQLSRAASRAADRLGLDGSAYA